MKTFGSFKVHFEVRLDARNSTNVVGNPECHATVKGRHYRTLL
jgi:hypothetical protein